MTAQVLAYTKNAELRERLSQDCRSVTGFAPVVHSDLRELASLIELLRQVEVLIIDWDDIPTSFLNRVFASGIEVKLVIGLGAMPRDGHEILHFPRASYPAMIEHLKDVLGSSDAEAPAWSSIPVQVIRHFKKVPFDLYVKISDVKFVKRIPAHEEVEETLIEDYQKRGIREFYFDKQHNRDFSKMLINSMINRVEESHDDIDQELEARSQVFQTVKEIVLEMGVSSRVVEVCETLISTITEEVQKSGDELGAYLQRIKHNPNLVVQHKFIELTSFIGGQLIFGTSGWDKQEELKRYVFCAFFCDMTLTDTELIFCFNQSSYAKLTPFQKKEVYDHAVRSSQLVAKCKDVPQDAGLIIRQHHGSTEGLGFPEKKHPMLHPLAKILVISQELAYGILTHQNVPALELLKKMVGLNRGTALQNLVVELEKLLEDSRHKAA